MSYLREWDHRRSLESAAAAGRKSVELADELYRKGLTSFLDVLDAERELHAAELELAASETAVSLNVVTLYKALGGGRARADVLADDPQARAAGARIGGRLLPVVPSSAWSYRRARPGGLP